MEVRYVEFGEGWPIREFRTLTYGLACASLLEKADHGGRNGKARGQAKREARTIEIQLVGCAARANRASVDASDASRRSRRCVARPQAGNHGGLGWSAGACERAVRLAVSWIRQGRR